MRIQRNIGCGHVDCETIRRVGIDIDQRSPVGVQLKCSAVQRARAVQLKGRLVLGMRLFIGCQGAAEDQAANSVHHMNRAILNDEPLDCRQTE